ncbi:MAG: hypothetical protein ACUVS3_03820 [Thermodesulfobacteriota bacterium]
MSGALVVWLVLFLLWAQVGCDKKREEARISSRVAPPGELRAQCEQMVGPPRVERVSERIWVALGFDLANVVLVSTP